MTEKLIEYLEQKLKDYNKATDARTRKIIQFMAWGAVDFIDNNFPEISIFLDVIWTNNYREKFGF